MVSICVNASQHTGAHNNRFATQLRELTRHPDEFVRVKMTMMGTGALVKIAVDNEHVQQ